MKKILFTFLLTLPIGAFADHIDVIEFTLHMGCKKWLSQRGPGSDSER
jgi:hypothetical protein